MDQLSPSTSSIPKRPRRWRRRLVIAFLCLGLVVGGGFLVFLWTASSSLERIVAELDRLDPGWRMEDIEARRKEVPDTENSALRIMAASQLLGGKIVASPATDKMSKLPPQVRVDAQQAAVLEKHLESLGQAVEEARKLQDMPEGRWPVKYDAASLITPRTVSLLDALNISKLLALDAMRRADAADSNGAVESCLAIQHAGQSMGDDPTLMAHLIRLAATTIAVRSMERTLAQCECAVDSEPTLKRMQAALAKELPHQAFLEPMRAERAFTHEMFQLLADGKIDVKKAMIGAGSIPLSDLIETTIIEHVPGYLTQQHAMRLRMYTDLIEILKLPAETREKRLEAFRERVEIGPILVRKSVPYLLGRMRDGTTPQADLRCAVAALAAERYRIARKRWPESLDELVKSGFLDAVPVDPYDFKPLRLKRTTDGLVVYSVGPDLADNGGNIARERPGRPGMDLGFRLWDSARRRQGLNPAVADKESLSQIN